VIAGGRAAIVQMFHPPIASRHEAITGQRARDITKSCPSPTVTVGPPGGVVGACARTIEHELVRAVRVEGAVLRGDEPLRAHRRRANPKRHRRLVADLARD
jgi:hypothetical protein